MCGRHHFSCHATILPVESEPEGYEPVADFVEPAVWCLHVRSESLAFDTTVFQFHRIPLFLNGLCDVVPVIDTYI